jgi:hypothetical protein
MSRVSDLVLDSKLSTKFHDSKTFTYTPMLMKMVAASTKKKAGRESGFWGVEVLERFNYNHV